jgi:hypothetical protein
MRRCRLLLGAGMVALLGVAGFVLFVWLTTPTPGVTWENFRRLRVGMSLEDVEQMLGRQEQSMEWGFGAATRYWWGEDVVVDLTFDTDQRLLNGTASPRGSTLTEWEQLPGTDGNFLDRVRRWLHW